MNSPADSNADSAASRFEVFFDGDCPLCKREIDMIRRMDRDGTLNLIDIASPGFDPTDTGKSLDTLMREIHGRYPDGRQVMGVDVFREVYQRVGWGGLVAPSRWPVVRHLLDAGYRIFAPLRYRHAMKRMQRHQQDLCSPADGQAPSCRQASSLMESEDQSSQGSVIVEQEAS